MYEFEKSLQNNELSMAVIDARRFGAAVWKAMELLRNEASIYKLHNEQYYKDTQAILEEMATRLEAKDGSAYNDARICAIGSTLIQKHMVAWKALAEGEPPKAWKVSAWGAHICPYCGFGGGAKEEYIGAPYRFCPDCGEPVAKPSEEVKEAEQ